MQSYDLNPTYRMMMAQMLQAPNARPNAGPVSAAADAGSQMVQALMLRNQIDQGQKRQSDYSADIASALAPQPVDNVAVTPQVTGGTQSGQVAMRQALGAYDQPTEKDLLSKLLTTGNPDVTQEFAPIAVKQQAEASAPLTTAQRAQLGQQIADNQRQDAQFRAGQEFTRGENALNREAQTANTAAMREFTGTQNQLNRDNAQNVAGIRAGSTGSNVQSVQPLGNGQLLKVFRDGRTEVTTMDGSPVMGARNDPNALFNQAAATSGGKAAGTAAEAAPTLDANFNAIMETISGFKAPEVRKQAPYSIGYGSMAPTVPGFNSDFRARLGQVKGQAFLQAFDTLKGGGAITEMEGAKATEAIGRLNSAQTESEFYSALDDFEKTISAAYAGSKTRASRGAVVPQLQVGVPSPDDLVAKWLR